MLQTVAASLPDQRWYDPMDPGRRKQEFGAVRKCDSKILSATGGHFSSGCLLTSPNFFAFLTIFFPNTVGLSVIVARIILAAVVIAVARVVEFHPIDHQSNHVGAQPAQVVD